MMNVIDKTVPSSRDHYFFVLSILALTGFEYFYRAGFLIIILFILALIVFIAKGYKARENLFLLLLPIAFISLIQTFLGYNQSIFTSLLLVISFLTYYFITIHVQQKFSDIYIDIIFAFCLVSLIFFPLTYYQPFLDFVTNKVAIYFKSLNSSGIGDIQSEGIGNANIIIYNFKNYAFTYNRNSGPFWEPGMFVIFINAALYLNIIIYGKLISTKNLVFIAAIITTFSTTGYIALLFVIITYFLFYFKSRSGIFFILLLLIGAIYIAQLDFMQAKILAEIENSNSNGASRFGAIFVHLKVIGDYPITGMGDGAAKIISKYTDADSTANGLTFVFVKYGLIIGLLYYFMLLKSCINIVGLYSQNLKLGYCFFILLIILAFSQDVTVRHFYFFIIVYGLYLPAIQFKKKYGIVRFNELMRLNSQTCNV